MRAIKKAARDYGGSFSALMGLILVAAIVGGYILYNERFRFPFISPTPVRMQVEVANADAVTPGQGQTVQVAGVEVGQVGKPIELVNGRARITMEIEPRFIDLFHQNATALLRPRTGLEDMVVQVDPGSSQSPPAREGFIIPLRNSAVDVDLDEILASLDTDTRDYLRLLINGAGRGLEGRGGNLAEVFRRFEPTVRDLSRVNRSVASEREALKGTITGLARVSEELGPRADNLAQLVDASSATFRAFASEDDNLSATIGELPSTLRQATTTLNSVRGFADELGPTADRLIPAFRALDRANRATRPAARELTPVVRDQIRPFTRRVRPLVRDLAPAAKGLADTTPGLTRSFRVLNTLTNLAAYNPNGREAPEKAGRQEGFLFWAAWTAHLGTNLQNIDDANGPMRPLFLTGTCTTLTNLVSERPELEFGLNLSPVLTTVCGNPATPSIDPAAIAKQLLGNAPVSVTSRSKASTRRTRTAKGRYRASSKKGARR